MINAINRFAVPPRAIFALARKDLRLLRPVIVGLVVLNLVGFAAEIGFQSPDDTVLLTRDGLDQTTVLAEIFFGFAIALIAALVSFAGERDAKTQEFTATLPVPAPWVVLTKFAVVASVILGSTWLSWGFEAVKALGNPDSIAARAITGPNLLLTLGMSSWLALVTAAHAVWLSWMGRMAWLVVAATTFLSALLPQIDLRLSPYAFQAAMTVQHHGARPLVFWRGLAGQTVVAILGLAIGTHLWLRDRERAHDPWFPRLRRFQRTVVWGGGGGLAFLLVLGLAILPRDSDNRPGDETGSAASSEATQRTTTRRFVFTYHTTEAKKAQAIAATADAAYDRLLAWLGTAGPKQIPVDLTYRGVDLGGLALGGRVRLDIRRTDDVDELRSVLLHELVHVIQSHLAGTERIGQEATLRFFSEGMAEHVAFALSGDRSYRQQGRRRAAWARTKYGIRLRDLFDAPAFVSQYDERWLYDFGEAYAAAVSEVCGREAPLRLYQRIGDPALPVALRDEPLFRFLLAADGCALDRVEAKVEIQLATLADDTAGTIPVVRARFQRNRSGTFEFDVRLRPSSPAVAAAKTTALLTLRQDGDTSPRDHAGTVLTLTTPLTHAVVKADHLDADRFQYRIGVVPPWGGSHLFTRWRTTTSR